MRAFGQNVDPKWSPELDPVDTPVGQACIYCGEPIAAGEVGILMPWYDGVVTKEVPQHRECTIRGIFGSVGHLTKACHCFGGNAEDPEGMTKRQAAKAAAEMVAVLGRPMLRLD